MLVQGRSSFCEATRDFELGTLSFVFLCAEVFLVASRSKLTSYLDAMHVC